MVRISKLLPFCLSTLSIAASVIPKDEVICSSQDPKDCYPKIFKPSEDWKPIREGQQIPQGLDIRLDWQTGEKSAKLVDKSNQGSSQEIVVHDIVESDTNKIVSYSEEGYVEDSDIKALKMAASSSNINIDLDDALEIIVNCDKSGITESKKLLDALDSLTEHSHNLKDGITIAQPQNFGSLFNMAISEKYNLEVRELALRTIAQSFRHNAKALANVDIEPTFLQLFTNLAGERDPVIQKRILGLLSSLIQSDNNSRKFIELKGETTLLNSFGKLKEDSKIRVLEILDDLQNAPILSKRSSDEREAVDKKLFESIATSLSKGSVQSDDALEILFDKMVALKTNNKTFKANPEFLSWLVDHIQARRLNKRDTESDQLGRKLLEARHLVFGNPNALRKALDDEL